MSLEAAATALDRAVTDRDTDAYDAALGALWQSAREASPREMAAVLPVCAGVLRRLPIGMGAQLAILCGAFVEHGVPAAPVAGAIAEGFGEALSRARRVRAAWDRAGRPVPLPGPQSPMEEYADLEAAIAPELGAEAAASGGEGWYALGMWQMPALSLLQLDAEARRAFPRELAEACADLAEEWPDLEWIAGLLAVLDDEPLLVLHRPSGRGYEVTIGGLGDNFQLHTLLAGALSGPEAEGLLGDLNVDPRWIAAASDGPEETFGGSAEGRFNPVDAYGKWIWNEGVPADIPFFEGRRVVVLDPPAYGRSWSNNRRYPQMRGVLRLDRVLPRAEAATWLAKVAPSA
ncbi:hypothetical protein Afil01_50260 [Actinorhabdospora filicis]|uniref:Uncharacterized protein n=1 Tax=Actinorhabdospora filicis TaxID=1785913 RepID=A0A9W6SNN6_9ACTN|nr:hypothetical protein [Actinorhabdospora filicis]GLZ80219.1 hypothetical protein Afil01_50260 [Actinorhabdospora filicis]